MFRQSQTQCNFAQKTDAYHGAYDGVRDVYCSNINSIGPVDTESVNGTASLVLGPSVFGSRLETFSANNVANIASTIDFSDASEVEYIELKNSSNVKELRFAERHGTVASLWHLDISGTQISSGIIAILSEAKVTTTLSQFYASGLSWGGTVDISEFDGYNLDLSGNALTAITLPSTFSSLWGCNLNLANNALTAVTIPEGVTVLDLGSNKFASLPAIPAAVTQLDVSNNGFTELNLSGLTELQTLIASDNDLKNLDLTANTTLHNVAVDGNKNMTSLKLAETEMLKQVNISRTKVPFSNVPKTVMALYADEMQYDLGNADLTAFENLWALHISKNGTGLTGLSLAPNEAGASREYYATDNNLTTLTVPAGACWLRLDRNHLAALDLTQCEHLEEATLTGQTYPDTVTLPLVDGGAWSLNMSDIVGTANLSNVKNVIGYTSEGETIKPTVSSGVYTFAAAPSKVTYNYDTGAMVYPSTGEATAAVMDVTITTSATPVTLEISGLTPLLATIGKKFTFSATVSGGSSYTWAHISGNLPTGLTLSSTTKAKVVLSGTPTEAGKFTFTLEVTDKSGATAKKKCTITVAEAPTIDEEFKNTVAVGNPYSSSITVKNGSKPFTWTNSSGTLPEGLELVPNSTGTKITLKGTPTTAKKYTFRLKVKDVNGATASKQFTVAVTKPTLSGDIKARGIVKKPYSSSITISGGTSPYTWSYTGTLPKGLELVPNSTGTKLTVKGTPTTAKAYTFTLKATDKNSATASKKFTVTVTKPVISGDIKANSVVKESYSSSVTVSGGTSPYTWTHSGTLPKGLELVPNSTGTKLTVKGTPTTAKAYTFTLKATDKNSATASKKFTVTVTKPVISGDIKANSVVKESYSSSVTVSGGTSPYTWFKSSGTLPKGLELVTNSTGSKVTLKGTPITAKEYTFTLKVTDKNGATASKKFTVTITKPTISGTLTTSGTVKKSYSSSLTVSGGTSPYVWTYSGTLPTGLKLTCNTKGTKATLKGTPTTAKAYTFTLKVTDKNSATASKKVTVTITKAATTSKSNSTEAEQTENTAKNLITKDYSVFENIQVVKNDVETDIFSDSYELTKLNVLSDDVLWQGTDKDEDIIGIHAGKPVTFVIGEWVNHDGTAVEVSDIQIFIDDEVVDDVNVSDLRTFTIKPELINGDFKIQVKAKTQTSELETEELFISVEE